MTRAEAQEVIEARIGQRTGLGSRIVTELKLAQSAFERRSFLPWFLRKIYTATITASPMTLPSDFLREVEDESLVWLVDGTTLTPLAKDSWEFLSKNPDLTGTGKPEFYALSHNVTGQVEFFPRPDISYAIQWVYYRKDNVLLSDSTENTWLVEAPDLLIAKAGLNLAKALRSSETASMFASDLQEADDALKRQHFARDMAARSMMIGG